MAETEPLPTTIEAFNAGMERRGKTYRMVIYHRNQGFGLEVDDGEDTLCEIPTTDEARAVWCALFFLEGMNWQATLQLFKEKLVDEPRRAFLGGWDPEGEPS